MAKQVIYETFASSEVSEEMLAEAATLFNENYGIWGQQSHRPGSLVHLSARRLRHECLPDASRSFYTKVTVEGTLAGHAFSCRWDHAGKTVSWVTQLVVHKEHRKRGLAGGLLKALKMKNDDTYGIMSSHPAACLAAAGAFSSIEKVSLDYISKNAKEVLEVSPVPYVRGAKLCGSIFNSSDSSGLISSVDTGFFVDHKEPLEALETIGHRNLQWPFGDLPEGHEYLLLVPAKMGQSRS